MAPFTLRWGIIATGGISTRFSQVSHCASTFRASFNVSACS